MYGVCHVLFSLFFSIVQGAHREGRCDMCLERYPAIRGVVDTCLITSFVFFLLIFFYLSFVLPDDDNDDAFLGCADAWVVPTVQGRRCSPRLWLRSAASLFSA